MRNHHLVILKRVYLDAILAGRKTVESRLMKYKREPFGRVQPGDRLFLKLSSGPVCAVAVAEAVKYFEDLTPDRISELKGRYNKHILGAEQYWRDKADCKFALLVWLKEVKAIEPIRIDKKDWRGWVVLRPEQNFGLLQGSIHT